MLYGMRLRLALDILSQDVVAFTGAGGKTSALVALGRELAADGWRVLATTTTRLGAEQIELFPTACHQAFSGAALAEALEQHRFAFYYTVLRRGKALGIAPEQLGDLMREAEADVALVEADGARRLPLKAPYSHEPVIPNETTRVVHVTGFQAFGQPLTDEHVYNARALAEAAGVLLGSPISTTVFARALTLSCDELPHADVSVSGLINQVGVDDTRARALAGECAALALRMSSLDRVLIGSVQSDEPIHELHRRVSAIVPAAGLSRRMGQPKPLLPWGDGVIIEQVVRTLRAAGVDEVVVITGAYADAVRTAAESVGARCVHNPAYAEGDMLSSLQIGLRALKPRTSAAIIALADQPLIRKVNVQRMLLAYAEGRGRIVAPSHQMRRGHPILIDRRYWGELLALPPGSAPRDAINRHADAIAYIDCDDSVLLDVDTPEAYANALRRAGLG